MTSPNSNQTLIEGFITIIVIDISLDLCVLTLWHITMVVHGADRNFLTNIFCQIIYRISLIFFFWNCVLVLLQGCLIFEYNNWFPLLLNLLGNWNINVSHHTVDIECLHSFPIVWSKPRYLNDRISWIENVLESRGYGDFDRLFWNQLILFQKKFFPKSYLSTLF